MRLSQLHPSLSREDRSALAKRAGMNEGYLWQLATQWRGRKPSLALLQRLAAADSRLSVAEMVDEFSGTSPVGEGAHA